MGRVFKKPKDYFTLSFVFKKQGVNVFYRFVITFYLYEAQLVKIDIKL